MANRDGAEGRRRDRDDAAARPPAPLEERDLADVEPVYEERDLPAKEDAQTERSDVMPVRYRVEGNVMEMGGAFQMEAPQGSPESRTGMLFLAVLAAVFGGALFAGLGYLLSAPAWLVMTIAGVVFIMVIALYLRIDSSKK